MLEELEEGSCARAAFEKRLLKCPWGFRLLLTHAESRLCGAHGARLALEGKWLTERFELPVLD